MKVNKIFASDLLARIPYGVVVEDRNGTHELTIGNTELVDLLNGDCHIKPYLRSISSITKKEDKERIELDIYLERYRRSYRKVTKIENIKGLDWLNAHHFDYRGWIDKGLAIEVTEENNPYNQK